MPPSGLRRMFYNSLSFILTVADYRFPSHFHRYQFDCLMGNDNSDFQLQRNAITFFFFFNTNLPLWMGLRVLMISTQNASHKVDVKVPHVILTTTIFSCNPSKFCISRKHTVNLPTSTFSAHTVAASWFRPVYVCLLDTRTYGGLGNLPWKMNRKIKKL